MEKPQLRVLQVTLLLRVAERYSETLHMKKMADLVVLYKFMTLLTFELCSFWENGFFILLHFPRFLIGHLKAREGRIEKTDTQTHRTPTVTLVAHACWGLITHAGNHMTVSLKCVTCSCLCVDLSFVEWDSKYFGNGIPDRNWTKAKRYLHTLAFAATYYLR